MPDQWEEKLTDFQKQIMIKVYRPEKLMFAFKKYVHENLGDFFTSTLSITMELLYNDTNTCTPLIFILSTGADPMANLLKFAEEREMRERDERQMREKWDRETVGIRETLNEVKI